MVVVDGATSQLMLLHLALALGLLAFQTQAAVDDGKVQWVLRALHTQSIVTENLPLHRLPSCGSRSSANFFESLPQLAQDAERKLAEQQSHAVAGYTLSGTLHLAEQCYNVKTQLELGVRHVHLELHLFRNTVRVCKSQQALCNNLKVVTGDSLACQNILGYSDEGASTGCTASSPTLEAVLQDLNDWVERNTDQVLIVRFHAAALLTSIGGCYQYEDINNAITVAIPFQVYTPLDLLNFRRTSSSSQTGGGKTWPSVKQITSVAQKNVVLLSSCNFGAEHVHDYTTAQVFDGILNEYKISAFVPSPSCTAIANGIQVSINDDFTFFYDDRYSADLTIQSNTGTSGRLTAKPNTGRITTRSAQQLMDCQFSPLMAGYGQGAAEGCIWTYRENHTAYCNPGMCTVFSRRPLSASRRYDWYNIACTSVRYLLCRDEDPNVFGASAWRLSKFQTPYPTSAFLDKPTITDQQGVKEDICDPGYIFHFPESPLEAGNILEMLDIGGNINITDEVYLGWKSGVTCRQGKETRAPPLAVPKVSSFDCPEVLREPYIHQPTASIATTAATTTPVGASTTKRSSLGISAEEQVGIIVGSLATFTLLLLLLYYGLYQRMSNAHSLDAEYQSTPNGPTRMTRRNVSSLGMNRAQSSTAGFQPLANEASPTGPMPQPKFPSLSRDISGHDGLQRKISEASGVTVSSPGGEHGGRKANNASQPPAAFPADFSQPPMTRYTSSSSGIPGLTEDEGIVRMNPLFAAQVAGGGFGQAENDEDDIDGGQDGADYESADGGEDDRDHDDHTDPAGDDGDYDDTGNALSEPADPDGNGGDNGDYDKPENAVEESADDYNDYGDYDAPENAEDEHRDGHADPGTGEGGYDDGHPDQHDDSHSMPDVSAPGPHYAGDADGAPLDVDASTPQPPPPPPAAAAEIYNDQGEMDDGADFVRYTDEADGEHEEADTAALLHNASFAAEDSYARGVPQDLPPEEQTYGLPMETPVGLMAEGELFY